MKPKTKDSSWKSLLSWIPFLDRLRSENIPHGPRTRSQETFASVLSMARFGSSLPGDEQYKRCTVYRGFRDEQLAALKKLYPSIVLEMPDQSSDIFKEAKRLGCSVFVLIKPKRGLTTYSEYLDRELFLERFTWDPEAERHVMLLPPDPAIQMLELALEAEEHSTSMATPVWMSMIG